MSAHLCTLVWSDYSLGKRYGFVASYELMVYISCGVWVVRVGGAGGLRERHNAVILRLDKKI